MEAVRRDGSAGGVARDDAGRVVAVDSLISFARIAPDEVLAVLSTGLKAMHRPMNVSLRARGRADALKRPFAHTCMHAEQAS